MRSEVLTAAVKNVTVFWDVTQCCLADSVWEEPSARILRIEEEAKCGKLAGFVHHEDGEGSLQNIGNDLADYTASHNQDTVILKINAHPL